MADAVASTMGSWRFVNIQTAIVVVWIAINLVAVGLKWDPYPFILLNLVFSTQAAYAAPILQMGQNRAQKITDALAYHHYEETQVMLDLLAQNTELMKQLSDANCEIVDLNRKIVALLTGGKSSFGK